MRAELYELDGKLRTALMHCRTLTRDSFGVSVFPMQDGAYEASELRMGVECPPVTLVLKD